MGPPYLVSRMHSNGTMLISRALRIVACSVLAFCSVSVSGSAQDGRDCGHSARYCCSCERDTHGRIKRSTSARRAFKAVHPCPATGLTSGPCPGYVIDHVVALKNGGADDPANMRWQTREDAKAKDRVE